jgi:hypothetical protein
LHTLEDHLSTTRIKQNKQLRIIAHHLFVEFPEKKTAYLSTGFEGGSYEIAGSEKQLVKVS